MTGTHKTAGPKHLASKVFENPGLATLWVIFLVVVLIFVSWPVRNFFLVWWVYGSDAYFYQGIYVLPGKPIRFSNGEVAPILPDLITGLGAFFITVFGLSLLLFLALRFYERHCRTSKINPSQLCGGATSGA
jgi:hypothetical protein